MRNIFFEVKVDNPSRYESIKKMGKFVEGKEKYYVIDTDMGRVLFCHGSEHGLLSDETLLMEVSNYKLGE